MKPTLQDIGKALKADKKSGDKHIYGQVQGVITDQETGKVTGYKVSLGGSSDVTTCRKLAGAKVGDIVLVTLFESGVAVVTGTLNGDTDAADADAKAGAADAKAGEADEKARDAQDRVGDIEDRIDDGEFSVDHSVVEYCLASASKIPEGGSFDDIQVTDWSTEAPEDLDDMYVWIRIATVMEDGNVRYGAPQYNPGIEEDPFIVKVIEKEAVQYCTATSSYIPDGQTFDSIKATGAVWVGTMPDYDENTLLYIWARNIVYFTDGTVEVGQPYFDSRAQVAAEAKALEESTGNYFWWDTTGAYITKTPQASYKQSPAGYAQRIVGEGVLSLYNGHKLVTHASTGTTFWDPNLSGAAGSEKPLVTYGVNGTEFNDDYDFTIGSQNRYIKWDADTGKVQIAADVIELGGESVLTDLDKLTIKSISYAYQLSTDGTQVPAGAWSPTPVAPTTTQYAWTRTTTVYSDNSTAVTYTVGGKTGTNGVDGADGADGKDGADGRDGISVTITSTSVKYQTSTSGTQVPTGTWQDQVPTVAAGNYLWTRTIVTYSTGDSTTSYSVARQGQNGQDITSQYMWFESTGTYAGLNIKYANYSNRINMNANGVNIYDGSGNNSAYFGSNARIGRLTDRNYLTVLPTGMTVWDTVFDEKAIEIGGTNGAESPSPYIDIGWEENDLVHSRLTSSRLTFYVRGGSAYLWGALTQDEGDPYIGAKRFIADYYVEAGTRFRSYYTYDNPSDTVTTPTLYVNSNGVVMKVKSSSERYKKDIEDADRSIFDPHRLLDIPYRQFRYKEGYFGEAASEEAYTRLHQGFIAEEVQAAFPPAAVIEEDGNIETWSDREIIPPMLALIQEHNERIKALEERIA